MRRYQHTQPGWWAIGGVAVFLSLILLRSWTDSRLVAAGAVGLAVTVLILLLFASLTVSVDETSLRLRFGTGLIRKRVLLSEIRSYRSVRNPWYYGWGIRFMPGGTLWNISGLNAVELVFRNGKLLRVGTDEPEALSRALQQALGFPESTAPMPREDRATDRHSVP